MSDLAVRDKAQEECLISIVLPCRDEKQTVGQTIEWCYEGLKSAGISGEVVVVDSSEDESPDIAAQHGARVVSTPPLGVGQAYVEAVRTLRGRWILMGDCDMTYDFRRIQEFVQRLEEGYEFVMGSRAQGYIEAKAMPKLHRYFGSPVTTWIFNRLFGTRFTDIHCGMRAITKAAWERMNIQSHGWEYASEMILKATLMRMRACEVPVWFYKSPDTRVSHLVRGGWATPWRAGWETLRVQVVYAPDFFLWRPGWTAFWFGFLILVPLALGPITLGPLRLDLHWELLASLLIILGYSAVQLATLARVHYGFRPSFVSKVRGMLTFNRGVTVSLILLCVGLIPNLALVASWLSGGLTLPTVSHSAVAGLTLIILGFQTFGFTLLLNLVQD